jgi:hypothetical protein
MRSLRRNCCSIFFQKNDVSLNGPILQAVPQADFMAARMRAECGLATHLARDQCGKRVN